tara:strand:- start:6186 stop:6779 length:594 start_codon:yes stop_codon:yes gene_type:complete
MTLKINSPLVIASGNLGKIKEFSDLFSELPLNILAPPNGFEVKETGKTFMQNARLKALGCAELSGECSIADDSGLSVHVLKGAPGINSARYAATDQERIEKILKELDGCSNRKATFTSALCIASSQEVLLEVEAHCEGFISQYPRGNQGFGYDPIFEVEGIGLTFAEMSKEKKSLYGHRGKAFKLLMPELRNILGLS